MLFALGTAAVPHLPVPPAADLLHEPAALRLRCGLGAGAELAGAAEGPERS